MLEKVLMDIFGDMNNIFYISPLRLMDRLSGYDPEDRSSTLLEEANARVVELVDTADSKPAASACGFKSHLGHQKKGRNYELYFS